MLSWFIKQVKGGILLGEMLVYRNRVMRGPPDQEKENRTGYFKESGGLRVGKRSERRGM